MIVRPANPNTEGIWGIKDASEIANVHITAWREAYAGIMPQRYLDTLSSSFKSRRDFWTEHLDRIKAKGVFVAEDAEKGIVGFVSCGAARDEQFTAYGEISAIYLLKQFQKRGIGEKLLKAALAHLRAEGFSAAYCWVIATNPTLGFYQRCGAKVLNDVTQDCDIDGVILKEVACVWDKI